MDGRERGSTFIYNPLKALELLLQRADIQPIRFFSVLFPLWSVEIQGDQKEKKEYWVIEDYIERGILQAGLQSVDELTSFLGLEPLIVKKVVAFLSEIGHVEETQGCLRLTQLGRESQQDRQKYIVTETHRLLYFDGFLSEPLPRDYYESRSIRFLTESEIASLPQRHLGEIFLRLYSPDSWDIAKLRELEKKPDRERYNVPPDITCIQQLSAPTRIYMHMYIFETRRQDPSAGTASSYSVYTNIKEKHDLFFEEIVKRSDIIRGALAGENEENLGRFWSRYVEEERRLSPSRLKQRENGSWQLRLLPADLQTAKGQKALNTLGSYWFKRGYFLHAWCDDEGVRRDAAIEQVLNEVAKKKYRLTREGLDALCLARASVLQVPEISYTDLKNRARMINAAHAIELLEQLEAEASGGSLST